MSGGPGYQGGGSLGGPMGGPGPMSNPGAGPGPGPGPGVGPGSNLPRGGYDQGTDGHTLLKAHIDTQCFKSYKSYTYSTPTGQT
jgi:hypothetical protein